MTLKRAIILIVLSAMPICRPIAAQTIGAHPRVAHRLLVDGRYLSARMTEEVARVVNPRPRAPASGEGRRG